MYTMRICPVTFGGVYWIYLARSYILRRIVFCNFHCDAFVGCMPSPCYSWKHIIFLVLISSFFFFTVTKNKLTYRTWWLRNRPSHLATCFCRPIRLQRTCTKCLCTNISIIKYRTRKYIFTVLNVIFTRIKQTMQCKYLPWNYKKKNVRDNYLQVPGHA